MADDQDYTGLGTPLPVQQPKPGSDQDYSDLGASWKPPVDYSAHDELVKENLAHADPKIAQDHWQAFQAGFGGTGLGMQMAGHLPDLTLAKDAPLMMRIAEQAGSLVGDAPAMLVGAIGGGLIGAGGGTVAEPGGGTIVGGAVVGDFGMNAVPEAYRQVMIDHYKNGDISSPEDLLARTAKIAWETTKAGTIGALTLGAGRKVKPVAEALAKPIENTIVRSVATTTAQASTELMTYTAASSALNGKLPSWGDFGSAAVMIMGMHGISKFGDAAINVGSDGVKALTERMADFYVKTGIKPDEQMDIARRDPLFREDLMGKRPGEDFTTADQYKRPDPPSTRQQPSDLGMTPGEMSPEAKRVLEVGRQELSQDEEQLGVGVSKRLAEKLAKQSQGAQEKWAPGTAADEAAAAGGGGKPPMVPPKGFETLPPEEGPKKGSPEWPSSDTALADNVMQIVGEQPTARKTVYDHFNDLYRHYVNLLQPAKALDKELNVKPGDYGIEDAFRQTWGSGQRASYTIQNGTIDPITFVETSKDSWKSAFNMVAKNGGDARGFNAYRLAKRAIELDKRGIESGIPLHQAEALVNRPTIRAKYEEAARMIARNKDADIDYAQQSGVFSKKQAEAIKQLNQDHITFNRIIGEEKYGNFPGANFSVRSPTKKIKGVERQITDPLAADIANKYTIIAMADRNRAIGSIVGAAEKGELANIKMEDGTPLLQKTGALVPVLDAEAKATAEDMGVKVEDVAPFWAEREFRKNARGNQIPFFRDGKLEIWTAADPELAAMIRGMDPLDSNLLTKVAQGFARVKRLGITELPEFSLMRGIRDELQIAALSEHGYRPYVDWGIGLWHAFKGDEKYQEWWRSGGAGSTLVEMDKNYLQEDLESLFRKQGVFEDVRNTVKNPIQALNWVNQRVDAGMRVGRYLKMREAGMETYKAGVESRQFPLDYAQSGSSTFVRQMSQATPFLRSRILGIEQFVSAMKNNPTKIAMQSAFWVTVPSVLMRAICWQQDQDNKGDPNYRPYDEIPRWERDLYFVFPQINGVRLRLQKPVGPLGLLFGALPQRFMDWALENDPRWAKDWVQDFIGEFIPAAFPTVIEPILETKFNKNFFTGKDLTPSSLEKVSPDLRYTPYTSEVAKQASHYLYRGVGLGVTPIQIETFVNDWLGGTGTSMLHMFDRPIAGNARPPTELADNPFVHSFVARTPQMDATSVTDFFDELGTFEQKRQDLSKATRRLNMDEMREALSYPQTAVKLDKISKTISQQNIMIQRIASDERMDDHDKRQLIDQLYPQIWAEAKFGLKIIDEVNALPRRGQ